MKKVLVLVVAILTMGSAFSQDTLLTMGTAFGKDTIVEIVAFDIKVGNVPVVDKWGNRTWTRGYFYTSESGERLSIKESEILFLDQQESLVAVKETKKSFDNNLNLGGYYIEKGAKLKNTAQIIGLVGGAILGLAGTQEDPTPIAVFGGITFLSATIINITGNSKIAKGGRLLKEHKL